MGDTVLSLDQPWSLTKIKLLIDGAVIVGDDLHTGLTAYEQRQKALDGFGEPSELCLEWAQLEVAIRGIKDDEVRHAMMLRIHTGADEYAIEQFLKSKRSGLNLLDRGCELIRRDQNTKRAQKRGGMEGSPVCWRCIKRTVDRPGEECAECMSSVPSKPSGRPQGSGDPVEEWDLDRLIRTQHDPNDQFIPGRRRYYELVDSMPVEIIDNDLAQYDKTWVQPHGIGSGRRRRNMPT